MLTALLIILIILWLVGLLPIGGISIPDVTLTTINNHPVTLINLLTLLIIGWIIGLLPRPLQAVASVVLILWILSMLGILAIGGWSSILILIIIIGVVVSLLGIW